MLADCATNIDMLCNTDKTVCMVFPPKNRRKVVASSFPALKLDNMDLKFVISFKYLGQIITNDKRDDKDMSREVRAMFTHTNILARRFSLCSAAVKIVLFRTYCICFYGMELWQCYNKCSVNRLRSSYIRCMKIFFTYPKYYSVTAMLLELGLPSFDTLLHNSRVRFRNQVQCSQNSIVTQLRLICACVCGW